MRSVPAARPILLLLTVLFVLSPAPARANDVGAIDVVHKIVFYIPNRVFDLVDIVRVRARVGPGMAAGARATEVADLYLGSYSSLYAGLPGPRNGREIPLPAGLETKNGVEAGVADPTLEGPFGPDYGPAEFGVSLHAVLLGADVGIDPVEIADFVVGLVTLDLREDDF